MRKTQKNLHTIISFKRVARALITCCKYTKIAVVEKKLNQERREKETHSFTVQMQVSVIFNAHVLLYVDTEISNYIVYGNIK